MRPSVTFLVAFTSLAPWINAQSVDAPVITNNPLGVTYIATLPNTLGTTVRGDVVAQSAPGGRGVRFAITVSGLPTTGGPYLYNIHIDQVPSDGNCTAAMGVLNPYNRGESPQCDASAPQTCQVGDLSGKHGGLGGKVYSENYIDLYASLVPGSPAFVGDRSIVLQDANLNRLACANFVPANLTNSVNATTATSSVSSVSGTATSSQAGAVLSSAASTAGSSQTAPSSQAAASSQAATGASTTGGGSAAGGSTGSPTASSAPAASSRAAASALGGKGGVAGVVAGLLALML